MAYLDSKPTARTLKQLSFSVFGAFGIIGLLMGSSVATSAKNLVSSSYPYSTTLAREPSSDTSCTQSFFVLTHLELAKPQPGGDPVTFKCLNQDRDFNMRLNQAAKQIFESMRGKQLVKELFQCQIQGLFALLGLDSATVEAAKKAAGCNSNQPDNFMISKSYLAPLNYIQTNSPLMRGLDSYTLDAENVILISSDTDLSVASLRNLLIHEYAVYLDKKSGNYPWYIANPGALGIHYDNVSDNRAMFDIMIPPLQNTFTAIRGFAVEAMFLRYIDPDSISPIQAEAVEAANDKFKCEALVQKLGEREDLWPFYWRFGIDSRNDRMMPGVLEVPELEEMRTAMRSSLDQLANINVEARYPGKNSRSKRISMCQYLALPLLSTEWIRNASGPRPRVGGDG